MRAGSTSGCQGIDQSEEKEGGTQTPELCSPQLDAQSWFESIHVFDDAVNDSISECRYWSVTSPDSTGGVLGRPVSQSVSTSQQRNEATGA